MTERTEEPVSGDCEPREQSAAERLLRICKGHARTSDEACVGVCLVQLGFSNTARIEHAEDVVKILSYWSVAPALREAVRDIESYADDDSNAGVGGTTGRFSPGLRNATRILRRHLAPWLDEDDTLPLSPEAMTQAKQILDQKETP